MVESAIRSDTLRYHEDIGLLLTFGRHQKSGSLAGTAEATNSNEGMRSTRTRLAECLAEELEAQDAYDDFCYSLSDADKNISRMSYPKFSDTHFHLEQTGMHLIQNSMRLLPHFGNGTIAFDQIRLERFVVRPPASNYAMYDRGNKQLMHFKSGFNSSKTRNKR